MRLSFTTMGAPGRGHRGVMSLAKKFGFQGVDLRCAPELGELTLTTTPAELTTLRSDFQKADLSIPSLLCYNRAFVNQGGEEAMLRETLQFLAVAQKIGAHAVRLFGGYPKEGEDLDGYIGRSAGVFREALKQSPGGPGIVIQNHQHSFVAREAAALARKVGDPRFGLVFSPDHSYGMGEADFDSLLNEVFPVTREIYVADVTADNLHKSVVPGEGGVPWGKIASFFESQGFSGFYSFKWEKIWRPELAEPEEVFPAFVKFMAPLAQRR